MLLAMDVNAVDMVDSFERFCNHDNYEVGVSYKEETNSHYCKPGYYLGSVLYSKCNVLFVAANSIIQITCDGQFQTDEQKASICMYQ